MGEKRKTLFALGLCILVSSIAAAQPSVFSKVPWMLAVDGGVEVRFELREAGHAQLSFVDAPPKKSARVTMLSNNNSSLHRASISALLPDTEYRLKVEVGAESSELVFRSPPNPEDDTSAIVFGDNRSQHQVHRKVVEGILPLPAGTLALHTGDMVAVGGDSKGWEQFFQIEGKLLARHPIATALGNHELIKDDAGKAYRDYFLPGEGTRPNYYKVDWGRIRALMLDSNSLWQDSEQLTWLKEELAKARDGRFVIVVIHHSPLSSGLHGPQEDMTDAGVLEVMRQGRVDLIVAGHDHNYERGEQEGVKYIVTGGGGAPLYNINRRFPYQNAFLSVHHHLRVEVKGENMHLQAVGISGDTVESCQFERGKPFVCEGKPPMGGEPAWTLIWKRYGLQLVLFMFVIGALVFAVRRRFFSKSS